MNLNPSNLSAGCRPTFNAQNFRCTVWFALAILAPSIAAKHALAQSVDRPNVVFVLVDDLGYMDIGANNSETFYETPCIDRLAAGGMRFTKRLRRQPGVFAHTLQHHDRASSQPCGCD